MTNGHQVGLVLDQARRVLIISILTGVFAGVATCTDSTGVEDPAGSYEAIEFVLSGAVSADVLAEGGSLSITLSPPATASGQLTIPASVPGGPFQADLAGTYTVQGDTVMFAQDADTFVRDIAWIAGPNRLTGSGTFSGTTVNVLLDRVGH